jgi:hypothetical protein
MTIIADGDNEEETADIFDYIHTILACPYMNNSTKSPQLAVFVELSDVLGVSLEPPANRDTM